MQICFRNISSAKLKWKECTRRHDVSVLGLTQVGYFILNFPWPIFIVVVFAIYCHLLSFLKNHQILLSLTFALCTSNLFHHKYIDKRFTKGNKKTSFPAKSVSPRNQFPRETSFPAKPVSPRNQFPRETSFPAKPVSPRNQFPRETSFPAKPVSPRNQFPRETSFPPRSSLSF